MVRVLTTSEANEYLEHIGMRIDQRNDIVDTEDSHGASVELFNYNPSRSSLHVHAMWVANWIPKGDWKILQIDNSAGWIDPVAASLIGGLCFGGDKVPRSFEIRTLLFEFDKDEIANQYLELLISNLIHAFLLLESFCFIVSSGSANGQVLGVRDGATCFSSRMKSDIDDAEKLITDFEVNPNRRPPWIQRLVKDADT